MERINKILKSTVLITVLFLLPQCGHSLPSKGNRKTAVVIFKGFNSLTPNEIIKPIYQTYGFETEIIDTIPLPQQCFINIKTPRYRADSLIRFLKRIKKDSYYNIIGLTHRDISTTKYNQKGTIKSPPWKYQDFGIFGLGFRPGPSAVLSGFRLSKNKLQKKEQLIKILLHEMGHNLGLRHCKSEKPCLMQDAAEKLKTINLVPRQLCENCRSSLNL